MLNIAKYLVQTNRLTTEYQYDGKPFSLRGIDACNRGVYRLFNGKRIRIIKSNEDVTTYHVVQHKDSYWHKVVLLILNLAIFPILLISIPAKVWSKENNRKILEIRSGQVQGLNDAAETIQTACRAYLKIKRLKLRMMKVNQINKNLAAIKIQRAYRAHYKRMHPSLGQKVYRAVEYYAPKIGRQLIPWLMKKCANDLTKAALIATAPALGLNPADVLYATEIEKMNQMTQK